MSETGRANAISEELAGSWCERQFEVKGVATRLDGDSDANFRLAAGDRRYILKVAAAGSERPHLDFQNALFSRLAAVELGIALPRPLPSADGHLVSEVVGPSGEARLLRLLHYVDGEPLAAVKPHPTELLAQIGVALGSIDDALTGFTHAAARRELRWDLAQYAWIRDHLGLFDGERREWLERVINEADNLKSASWQGLRTGVIHNDANVYNLLVSGSSDGQARLSGLIDFGDAIETLIVAEPAIACAYLAMDKADPVAAVATVIGSYHREFALNDAELRAVYPLLRLRLAISVVTSTLRYEQRPADEYWQISAAPAWRLLESLDRVHPALAEARLRAACGLEPCPTAERVGCWIATNVGKPADLLPDRAPGPSCILDLSVTSTDLPSASASNVDGFARWVARRMEAAAASIGIGRYDEARLLYTAPAFEEESGRRRTIHLGLDLFAPAGTRVAAPLEGRIHSWADNSANLDYGATVILEHGDEEVRFFSLYGHLSRDSLESLQVGRQIGAGEVIATLGDATENGGWPPHLHFQLICDLLGEEGNFPGVAAPDLRDVWLSLSPDPSRVANAPEGSVAPRPRRRSELRALRKDLLGPSLSLSYAEPLHIVRGYRQYLFDPDGRRYIDGVNNVAHVGHCHPRVVEAEQRQAARLNTNTRYLHENLLEYAERLTGLLPAPLSVCFFVCSGSEANELALRMAGVHTGSSEILALEGAYHGNTRALVDASSYKFTGPGGEGQPAHVTLLPMPDPYRGRFRGAPEEVSDSYVSTVEAALASLSKHDRRPGAFLYEPLMGCGGQLLPPPGYFAKAQEMVRAAGGVCIADEVQVGFGRVGAQFWGFALNNVVPDIVTMGKPIGNGYPLSAVVTTREIAESFDNGMEYFNTFGGNPVAAAVGLAVLDVVEEEQLSTHAGELGGWLLEGLEGLGARHERIGEVRGAGLFLGVEFVSDPVDKTPDAATASYVVEQMKEKGVLLSTDGPDHNVLKFKPPLVFERSDAEQLLEALDDILTHDVCRLNDR